MEAGDWSTLDRGLSEEAQRIRERFPGIEGGYYIPARPDQPFLPAAVVVSRVISLRGESRVCIDLGHKSIAPENELARRVNFLNVKGLRPVGQSEEHLVLEAGPGHGMQIGDVLYGVPFHICPTVALYDRVYIIEEGRVTGEWRTVARDRKLTV